MYLWLWRHLPGGTVSRAAIAAVLALSVVALLFFVVFPWVDLWLPFSAVSVD